MIVRTWRGQATTDNAGAYIRHFRESVLPVLGKIAGYKGAHILQRDAGGRVELLVLTKWESMQAIRDFAGDASEVAVVEPEARAVLAEFDMSAGHYEVVLDDAR